MNATSCGPQQLSPEIWIFCLLEVVLGPLFVYGDFPTMWTLIGGSLLLAVLAVHESLPLLERANDTVRASISKRMSSSSRTAAGAADASPVDERGVGSTEEEEVDDNIAADDERADAGERLGLQCRHGWARRAALSRVVEVPSRGSATSSW
jgi:hypothetical protein